MDEEGTIGTADLNTKIISIKQRTHKTPVVDTVYNTVKSMFVTLSKDGIIKGWNHSFVQEVEFESTNDKPSCLASHPIKPCICAGYESGCIRILDLVGTTLIKEVNLSNKEVKKLAFSQTMS